MPYNSYFPATYQNYYPTTNYQSPLNQQTYTQAPSNATSTSSIIWVQGEAGAKAFPVAAGNSILLMDSESEVFYLKSTDNSGMPMPLRTFSYKELVSQPSETASNKDLKEDKYITKEEFESRLDELKTALNDKLKAKMKRERMMLDDE